MSAHIIQHESMEIDANSQRSTPNHGNRRKIMQISASDNASIVPRYPYMTPFSEPNHTFYFELDVISFISHPNGGNLMLRIRIQ